MCVDSIVGTDWVDVPLCRSWGDGEAETPGGSSASLEPEYIVSMVAVAGVCGKTLLSER